VKPILLTGRSRFYRVKLYPAVAGGRTNPYHQSRQGNLCRKPGQPERDYRPGHDRRYAIDASKIEREMSWQPLETFESGIRKTIEWYLANAEWTRGVLTGSYRRWMALQYSL
jgi:hypothetical protein